jgi:dTMP kinase
MNNQQKKGVFITLEGIEGAGKSTASQYLADYLQQQGKSVVLTREPGGTPVAEAIRNVLLQHHSETLCPETELLLLFAGALTTHSAGDCPSHCSRAMGAV